MDISAIVQQENGAMRENVGRIKGCIFTWGFKMQNKWAPESPGN